MLQTPNNAGEACIYYYNSGTPRISLSATPISGYRSISAATTDDSWTDGDTVYIFIRQDASNWSIWLAVWDETGGFLTTSGGSILLEEGTLSDSGGVNVVCTAPSEFFELFLQESDLADVALSGSASDLDSGLLFYEYGGLELDVSAFNGVVKIASGNTTAVSISTIGESFLSATSISDAQQVIDLEPGVDVDEFTATVSQAEAEAGVATTRRTWTAERVAQAIAALASGGTSTELLLGFALSDETTDLETGEKIVAYIPEDCTITRVYASVGTAPTGAALTIDVEDGGSTILSSVISIAASGYYAETSTFTGSASAYTFSKNDLLTIDIDQVGSTVAGTGAKVYLFGTWG